MRHCFVKHSRSDHRGASGSNKAVLTVAADGCRSMFRLIPSRASALKLERLHERARVVVIT